MCNVNRLIWPSEMLWMCGQKKKNTAHPTLPSSGFSSILLSPPLFNSSQVEHFLKIDENQNEEMGRDGDIVGSPQVGTRRDIKWIKNTFVP